MTPRRTRIEDEIARRGIILRGRRPERCGPCPRCGGRDRFAINVTKQVWNCRGCGKGGDVIDLVRHLDGIDYRAARALVGEVQARPPQPAPARPISDGIELWRAAVPITGTAAESYLRRRGLDHCDPDGRVLRFHADCPFGPGVTHPCMLGLYRSVIGDHPVGIHRTALDAAGQKIGRMALGRIGGGAIKLTDDAEVTQGLAIAEGVETALAGMALGFKPAWAVGFAGGIRAFPVLAGVETLTIFVDNDCPDNQGRRAGPDAARECSDRWTAAGREVHRVIPRRQGADMGNLLEGAAA
jgi:putative DNA primase/helicase